MSTTFLTAKVNADTVSSEPSSAISNNSSNDSQNETKQVENINYFKSNPRIIEIKKSTSLYHDTALTQKAVTGDVNEKTWLKLGFSKKSWFGIDSYVAPLGAQAWQGRSAHINAMIN